MKKIIFYLLFLASLSSFATHDLGGYISYDQISAMTYDIKVTIYHDPNSPAISRNELEINWGDNSPADSILRDTFFIPNWGASKSIYIERHTFPGPGTFIISVTDPNRPGGIDNLTNSSNVPLYLENELRVFPFSFQNSSPDINSALSMSADIGTTVKFNISASDKDGDYLFYELVKPRGFNGLEVPSYTFPDSVYIDFVNGEFTWKSPSNPGTYLFSVVVSECRKGITISKTSVDFLVTTHIYGSDLFFSGINTLDRDIFNRYHIVIKPGDSVQLSPAINANPAFGNVTLQQINPVNNSSTVSLISDPGIEKINFNWNSNQSDLRCPPYVFVFRSRTPQGFIKDLTIMVSVHDSLIQNCDTLCGQNIISVQEHKNELKKIDLYPNPANDLITINSKEKLIRIEVYSSKGKLVLVSNEENIIVRNLATGIYFIKAETEVGIFTKKFIKQE